MSVEGASVREHIKCLMQLVKFEEIFSSIVKAMFRFGVFWKFHQARV